MIFLLMFLGAANPRGSFCKIPLVGAFFFGYVR